MGAPRLDEPQPHPWLARLIYGLANLGGRMTPHPRQRYSCVPGTEGIEWIEDTVVGDHLIFHIKDMPPYRQYFTWRGEEFAAFIDHGEVAVVNAEDLRPRAIPTVWCQEWRVEP